MNFIYNIYDSKKKIDQIAEIPASADILEKTDRITAKELENMNISKESAEDIKKRKTNK